MQPNPQADNDHAQYARFRLSHPVRTRYKFALFQCTGTAAGITKTGALRVVGVTSEGLEKQRPANRCWLAPEPGLLKPACFI